MADYVIEEGATDVTINVVWVAKTTGQYASVAFNAAGISVGYVRTGFDDAAITLAALADPDIADDAHSDGQMGVVYNGIHRLDLPDAVCASGIDAKQRIVTITGESDDNEMLPVTIQLSLGAPGVDLEAKIDIIDTNVDSILVDTAEIGAAGAGLTNINLPNQAMDIVGNITGNLSGSVGSVTGAVGSVTGGATAAELAKVPKSDSNVTWNATAAAQIQSEANDALVAYDPPTKAELDSGLDALPTAAENAAEILSEAASTPIEANIKEINDVAITGTGTLGTEWDAA